jgi:hypothetical protein
MVRPLHLRDRGSRIVNTAVRASPLADRQEVEPVLRKTVLGRRGAMDPGIRAALSRAIVYDLFDLAAYRRSGTVMAYVGFGSELQTDEFVLHTLDQGKTLLLPRVNRRKRALDIYEVREPGRDLEEGAWGIREARPDRCAGRSHHHRFCTGSRTCFRRPGWTSRLWGRLLR